MPYPVRQLILLSAAVSFGIPQLYLQSVTCVKLGIQQIDPMHLARRQPKPRPSQMDLPTIGATEISHTQFPRHDYTVPLPSTFRDVLSIELVKASIPISRVDKGDKDRYIILGIGYSRSQGNTANLTGSFCNIYSNDNGKYDYTRSETYADGGHTYYFSEPSTVAKLHITLTYPDGTSPCWGECPVSQTEHVLTFKIWTMNQPVILPV